MAQNQPLRNIWIPQLVRATLLLATGLVITFLANHETWIGLLTLGVIGVGSGLLVLWESKLLGRHLGSVLAVTQGLVSIAIGIIALVVADSEVRTLLFLIALFAGITGLLELFRGLVFRGLRVESKDWLGVGVLTCLLAMATVFLPADFSNPWSVEEHGVIVRGVVTAQVVSVGLIGAWGVLTGVYLAIAAFSNRWSSERANTSSSSRKGATIERTKS
ncbi:MAG: hypothetical protein IT191_04195 [Microbacteriaceae bacterium]|nr:hypothetical protein [Microbacteriaceae bacterium]